MIPCWKCFVTARSAFEAPWPSFTSVFNDHTYVAFTKSIDRCPRVGLLILFRLLTSKNFVRDGISTGTDSQSHSTLWKTHRRKFARLVRILSSFLPTHEQGSRHMEPRKKNHNPKQLIQSTFDDWMCGSSIRLNPIPRKINPDVSKEVSSELTEADRKRIQWERERSQRGNAFFSLILLFIHF